MEALSYREDVAFLAGCSSALVERNADEFKRLHDMLVEVDDPAERAEKRTHWDGEGSRHYVARLAEVRALMKNLAAGYGKASSALRSYAWALETAKRHYSNGRASERALADLIATKGTAITREAQEAEPMRQWEDLRATTGFFDFLIELDVDVDDIREVANRLHDAAGSDFHRAKTVEREARDVCVHELKQAYDLLPEFRTFAVERVDIFAAIAALRGEAAEASSNPLTHLSGSALKRNYMAWGGDGPVSPTLQAIRTQLAGLPDSRDDTYWAIPPTPSEDRQRWVAANKEIIRAAAAHSGVPADLVAGIAWQEIYGQPGVFDDWADTVREQADAPWGLSPVSPENLLWRFGGSPDQTSFGPIAIQMRRGAEVLGYDPNNLTQQQRDVVEESLQDPSQNVFIASAYLAQLKAESAFADVPPEQLTQDQYRELAARYNGGPYWQGADAQAYGRLVEGNLDKAREAMQ
ncbi:hypothetical protein [Streptomyces sp. NPDC051909]|uniref:hypothetical protein n=1 Tax=Streptomyces sp. NPDC051909 TaxID=3154944 RepID=UPI003430FAA5